MALEETETRHRDCGELVEKLVELRRRAEQTPLASPPATATAKNE